MTIDQHQAESLHVDTHREHVGCRQKSNEVRVPGFGFEPTEELRHLFGIHIARQFDELVVRDPPEMLSGARHQPHPCRYVVSGEGDGLAQFAETVVIGDEGRVGVVFGGTQIDLVDYLLENGRHADHARRGRIARRHDSDIAPTGLLGVGDGEPAVVHREAGRWKDGDVASVERSSLAARVPDGRCRGDHLRWRAMETADGGDGCFVDSDGCAQWA